MIRLLVSVRSVDEALDAAQGGADLIDLKEPAAGALGGLAPPNIALITRAVRASHPGTLISATIGDFAPSQRERILERVAEVAACGVDYVKVGIAPDPAAPALVHALAHCGAAVVPVLLADRGVPAALLHGVLEFDAFPAVMLDTEEKRGGSLVVRLGTVPLAGFIAAVQQCGCLAGLAGALHGDDLPALRELAPDFAGFRSAVCTGGRSGVLEPSRVRALRAGLSPAHSAAAACA